MRMKNNFTIGERVGVLDDDIVGEVVKISGNTITILSTDDFEFEFQTHELVKLKSENTIVDAVYAENISAVIAQKESHKKRKIPKIKPKERTKPSLVVDLHIDKLVDSTRNLTNYDMLTIQLDTAQRQIDFAIKKRIQKVVLIHGVGEGVLRMELETLLRRYVNLKFYDADYKTYGYGATEVYVFQNKNP